MSIKKNTNYLFKKRDTKKQGHEKDFLTVGSMGHASAIAMGIANFRTKRQVILIFFIRDKFMNLF